MSKRVDKIVAVTVAKYATMYIEAESVEDAVKYAKKHCDNVDDWDFDDSDVQVDSWETSPYQAEDYMGKIWVENGETMTYDDCMDELEDGYEDE